MGTWPLWWPWYWSSQTWSCSLHHLALKSPKGTIGEDIGGWSQLRSRMHLQCSSNWWICEQPSGTQLDNKVGNWSFPSGSFCPTPTILSAAFSFAACHASICSFGWYCWLLMAYYCIDERLKSTYSSPWHPQSRKQETWSHWCLGRSIWKRLSHTSEKCLESSKMLTEICWIF